MELQTGDWVKTQAGEVGRIVHISRLTVFVAIADHPNADRVEAYLESQLYKGGRAGAAVMRRGRWFAGRCCASFGALGAFGFGAGAQPPSVGASGESSSGKH